MLLYQILALTTFEKNISTKIMNSKYHRRHEIKSLNYVMDQVPYQIFRTILSISSKMKQVLIFQIYLNKIEKRNTLKLKQDIILNF